jgi:hypothetical protein
MEVSGCLYDPATLHLGEYPCTHYIGGWLGPTVRGGLSSTRGLGPTMTARGLGPTITARCQSIGLSIGMLPQTLIMSRLDQLSRLGARI